MTAKILQFAALSRRDFMAAPNAPQLPAGNPVNAQPEPAAPVPPAFAAAAQVQPYIPPDVWTPEAVIHFHDRQKEVIVDNNRLIDGQRIREYNLARLVLAGFAAIVAVGFMFAYLKMDIGRDILISAVSAGLGYAAGYGTGLTKRQ
jgi:hypothetical protein